MEIAHCRGLGRTIAQAPFQAGVIAQQASILRRLSADNLEQDGRFDHLPFVMSSLAFTQFKIGLDQTRQAEGAKGARNSERASMRAAGLGERARIQHEGSFVQDGQSR